MSSLTPQEFVEKWRNTPLKERQSYQLHFVDVCHLIGHKPPDGTSLDERGKMFLFERAVKKESGKQGFADVYYEDHFAIEYKGSGEYKDLKEAYNQLRQYRENLKNPPLLIVTDIDNWEIHTNWPNTDKKIYSFTHEQLLEPSYRRLLRNIFEAPQQLHPDRDTEQVTKEAASAFKAVVDNMRNEWQADPETIARFLTKLVFSLFAEDIGLLPANTEGRGLFTEIVDQTRHLPDDFRLYMEQLFAAMRDGGKVMFRDIPYFNGALFEDVSVARLSFDALNELDKACHLNWSSVEPAVFGTLFERTLDPGKRAQFGAHYTSPTDIELILEPVLMQPLRQEWEALQAEALPLRQKYDDALAKGTIREQTQKAAALTSLRDKMLKRLRDMKVLDPACGSGNFLYISLRLLMTMEKEVVKHPLWERLPEPELQVHPDQMYGIEKDEIAHDLASIVVWIGYLQWREENGYLPNKRPILKDLGSNIRRMDAIMNADGTEPDWPEVEVIVGNPPFLGGKRMRGELGDDVDKLFAVYEGRVPPEADLVCYWFEKARAHIEVGKAKRAGLLATQAIRAGASREVIKRIKDSGDIFLGWSNRRWVLDGAAVRVSMIGFDNGGEQNKSLDGVPVDVINPDLTSRINLTIYKKLNENLGISYMADTKGGAFDIPAEIASRMLKAVNKSGRSNSDVVRPWVNGLDVTQEPRNMWIIDFGIDMSLQDAQLYELPFAYIQDKVFPERLKNHRAAYRERWWIHVEPRPAMRLKLSQIRRYIATVAVAKHRIFVWFSGNTLPDHRLFVFAREDDFFFGVLHSSIHKIWSLATASRHGDGDDGGRPTYNNTTCFETFPFPWPPGQEDVNSLAYQAISAAAKQLDAERSAWLNPAGASERELKDRTLTNLYNALNVWRGKEKMKTKDAAADFAVRLDELHNALDKAVCDAYGWSHDILNDEEAILRNLLALNLERAALGGASAVVAEVDEPDEEA